MGIILLFDSLFLSLNIAVYYHSLVQHITINIVMSFFVKSMDVTGVNDHNYNLNNIHMLRCADGNM